MDEVRMQARPKGAPPSREVADWEAAEANAVAWMKWFGHADARLTPRGADGGIDVMAMAAFAQVKWYGKAVGPQPLRQLFGARANRPGTLYFFTNGGYSPKALEYAESVGMAAFLYSPATGLVTPVSSTARSVFDGAVERAKPPRPRTPRSDNATPSTPRRSSQPDPPWGQTRVEHLESDATSTLSASDVGNMLRSLRGKRDARLAAEPVESTPAGTGRAFRQSITESQPDPSPSGCLAVAGFLGAASVACCYGRVDRTPPTWLVVFGAVALLVGISATIAIVRRRKSENQAQGG
ncbi:restriction endonuclease [Micromonospora sp. NPDC006766]|uniref:restriction endonuclease n=1 Tax=Micromonospora sp. NPDC006766 TaxID=3154778 RepID=UPI00340D90BD